MTHEASKPQKHGTARRRYLTPRRVKFVKALVKGKSLTDAALEAGFSGKNPGQSGHQALKQIQKTAPELLAAHGITDDVLIENYLKPALNATETKFFPYSRRGERKLLTRTVKAWGPKLTALDIALKIRGLYVKEQENSGQAFTTVILNAVHRPPWSQMKRAQFATLDSDHVERTTRETGKHLTRGNNECLRRHNIVAGSCEHVCSTPPQPSPRLCPTP